VKNPKFWSEDRDFGQKSKFSSNRIFWSENRNNLWSEDRNFCQKSTILVKNGNFDQEIEILVRKSKFWSAGLNQRV